MEEVNELLIELYKFSEEILTLNNPIESQNQIINFEKKHNLKLPQDFKNFLTKHDGIDLMGVTIYGFTGEENIETVYNFEHFKVAYPQYEYLVPFSPDGSGNFYCFDTRNNNIESCSIVFWTSNYPYSENDQPEIVNESFVEWVKEVMIEWTLESYNYDGSEL